MPIDPTVLATLTSAVTVIGSEYLKGFASDAGKATWGAIKSVFGWSDDPQVSEIPQKVAGTLAGSPELADQLLDLLKSESGGTASAMVGKIESHGGKLVIAQTIVTNTFQM